MYYVYILQSEKDRSFYTGFTEDLKKRVFEHNTKTQHYSSKKAPFKLSWYCAFLSKKRALDFEKYLKSGSGFAFARKRLVS
ncbi:MAG TPA: GIY-YIG nuclease family protein [Candidatus Paceibacterota bacterium]